MSVAESGTAVSTSGSRSGSGSRLGVGAEEEEVERARTPRTPDTLPPAYRDYMDPPVESPVEDPRLSAEPISSSTEQRPELAVSSSPSPPSPSSPTFPRENPADEEERRD